jgi:CTP:molybdopterin cytidylyltransferase MocA
MTWAGLVLAAGSGSRLGRPKAEVSYAGRPLLDTAAGACLAAGLDPVVVVLGAATPRLPPGVGSVPNPDWATGMASSLRTGLLHLAQAAPQAAGAVVTLVDTPAVGAEHLLRVCRALTTVAAVPPTGRAAVATYQGAWRTPVALGRGLWATVAAEVSGDRGAGPWLRRHPDLVTPVECGDLGPWLDVDEPADLRPPDGGQPSGTADRSM